MFLSFIPWFVTATISIYTANKIWMDHLKLKYAESQSEAGHDRSMLQFQKHLEGGNYADPLKMGNPGFWDPVRINITQNGANKQAEYEKDIQVINPNLLNKKKHIHKEDQEGRAAIMGLEDTHRLLDPQHNQLIVGGPIRAIRIWNPRLLECVSSSDNQEYLGSN